ncbi:hypothetical protein HH303_14000 [Rhodospirillaceae bacterium KN72]|uniref:Glycosyltransferase RgtA/B/C/D-like domain-containing protein n=1 Tax=Pacificispira spongiicola TaxID=2729598 RepID=A0A7Y0E1N0_9PROT|nr:glycosyltransferase family 39 protein [Pacificispira spongiicola]NMM45604.1 hypothetical protein [Pacificispira spongiicola]
MTRINSAAVIVLVAFALRVAYDLVCYSLLGPAGLMGPDSAAFLLNAQYLSDGGSLMTVADNGKSGFALDLMPISLLLMAATLTPGQPADPIGYVLVQAGMDAVTCLLIGRLAEFLEPRLFVPAALLAAVNPTQIVVAGLVYTDTPFLFFCCLGLVLFLEWQRTGALAMAVLSGLAWGGALMTRQFIQYWLFLLPVLGMLAAASSRPSVRDLFRRACHLAVMGGLIIAFAAPIALRNMDQFGSPRLSAQSGSHFLFWVVPLVREFNDGTPRSDSKARGDMLFQTWQGEPPPVNPFDSSDRMMEIAKQELLDLGPGAVVAAWVKGAALNLVAPASTISPLVSSLPHDGFYATAGDGLGQKIWNFLVHNSGKTFVLILVVSGIGMPIWLGLGITGFVRAIRRPEFACVVLFLWVGFVLALNGPVVSPKYRLPLEPAWIAFAALGWNTVRHRVRVGL